jgi:hypothetical protein
MIVTESPQMTAKFAVYCENSRIENFAFLPDSNPENKTPRRKIGISNV